MMLLCSRIASCASNWRTAWIGFAALDSTNPGDCAHPGASYYTKSVSEAAAHRKIVTHLTLISRSVNQWRELVSLKAEANEDTRPGDHEEVRAILQETQPSPERKIRRGLGR